MAKHDVKGLSLVDPSLGSYGKVRLETENVRSILLLVLPLEALELPGIDERANMQRPHAEYAIRPCPTLSRRAWTEYTYPPGIYCLLHS